MSKPIIATIWDLAEFKVIEDQATSTGGATTDYYLRPAADKRWKILCAYGEHNASSAKDSRWLWFDGSLSIHHQARSTAAGVRVPLHSFDGEETSPRWLLADPIITRGSYAVFQVANLGSGKEITVEAAYYEVDD